MISVLTSPVALVAYVNVVAFVAGRLSAHRTIRHHRARADEATRLQTFDDFQRIDRPRSIPSGPRHLRRPRP